MSKPLLNVAICGATGRMGKELLQTCLADETIRLVAACSRGSSKMMGQDISCHIGGDKIGLNFTDSFEKTFLEGPSHASKSVVVDFSSPEAVIEHSNLAAKMGVPILVGVSGLQERHKTHLSKVSKQIPVLVAPNTSVGANLLALISAIAAKHLEKADVEICETHHRHKLDAPSGAAYYIAEHIAQARNTTLNASGCFNRHESGPRKPGEIGVFGLRGGNQVGTHTVHIFDDDESLELTHRVTNRRVFAVGAIKAAQFLVNREPGIYNMFDVFNIGNLLGEKS